MITLTVNFTSLTELGLFVSQITKTPAQLEVHVSSEVEDNMRQACESVNVQPEVVEVQPEVVELDFKKDVRPLAAKLTKLEGGREALLGIFKDLGVANAVEVKPEDYPTFVKMLNAKLGDE